MIPWPSQIETAVAGYTILEKYGLVYLAGEERTGKLLSSLVLAEMCPTVEKVLVLTTKKALAGWHDALDKYSCTKEVYVTNYHQAKKLAPTYDLVILDESHNYISSYPKRSGIWEACRKLTKGLPIIYSSATPYAQGQQMLFNQFALSDWSPWASYKNFYTWFTAYGIEEYIWLGGRKVAQYNKCEPLVVEHLFVTKTRKELGFTREPVDVLHYIELSEATKNTYNTLLTDKYYEFLDGTELICDTPAKLRATLHQLEGGGCKIDVIVKDRVKSTPKVLANREKVDYIIKKWGDSSDICIMYQYHSEREKLEAIFNNALILQGTANAEGVDLSHIETLIIYSQDFRTSKHSQRRARQANKHREDEIDVHYLLVKGAISEQVYNTVSINKQNFVDSVFLKEEI